MSQSRHIKVWESCLSIIKDNIPEESYKTWFAPIEAISLEGATLSIKVPSDFFREYLEEHYIDLVSRTLKRVMGKEAKLLYNIAISKDSSIKLPTHEKIDLENRVKDPYKQNKFISPFAIPGLQQIKIDSRLNPNYSFKNFIEGECNKLGYTAGLAIAKKPGGTPFNPLFIYGGAGLGKTHLAQAIGIAIKEQSPKNIVLYVSANIFQTQYMDAVNVKNKLTDFLNFYRFIDTLIIDDVHEFADKPGTQNAFFHIFNALHQSGKQLILTSDKAPVELMGLEQRLLSRFKWGLSVELLPPSFETRVEILRAKSREDGIELSDEILTCLASNITGNVRELEGTLISLLAHATLNKELITVDLAKRLIDKIVTANNTEISMEAIQEATCQYFNITRDTLVSKTRKREISQARQIVMYLGRNLTRRSLASIGASVGGRDHATVLHACNTVTDLMETDKNFKRFVDEIENELKNPFKPFRS